MNKNKHPEILAKKNPDISLYDHLNHVKEAAVVFAEHLGYDKTAARYGAILHDIGKVFPEFQKKVDGYDYGLVDIESDGFRHEIASLFFISLVPEKYYRQVTEMIIAHHKTPFEERGLYKLIKDADKEDILDDYIENFSVCYKTALEILNEFGINGTLTEEQAKANFNEAVNILYSIIENEYGPSKEKGILMGADHYASAINEKSLNVNSKLFQIPDEPYKNENRKSKSYPLSLISEKHSKKHTLVIAPTGAGKTDFLLRRTRNRIFYILPFTASINAMYKRIKNEAYAHNKNLDIRLLHSVSKIHVNDNTEEAIQDKFGASIKVLTPHQIANIVLGIKNYESILLDLKGCDIILDEIHTYSNIIQGIVLKMIEILKLNGCNIHIGTATLPTALKNKIFDILDEKETYEVKLTNKQLNSYNRHIIHKIRNNDVNNIIKKSVNRGDKLLIVKNKVRDAQETYNYLIAEYPNLKKNIILLHSRFKRGKRNELEDILYKLNDKSEPCIVISTQVVEVSLDISFDCLITDCSPIDSLIQRMGRVNRKRMNYNIFKIWYEEKIKKNIFFRYKPVYIIQPPDKPIDCLPYTKDVLDKTYHILPNGELLKEKNIQNLLDKVYDDVDMTYYHDINSDSIYREKDGFTYKKLYHRRKGDLLSTLQILTTNVILEKDKDKYNNSTAEEKISLEIPVMYHSLDVGNEGRGIETIDQIDKFHKPFVIPDWHYNDEIGLLHPDNIRPSN